MSATISQAPITPWLSRAGDSPASIADLFRQAAKLIEAGGYSPRPEGVRWDVDGPHSVSSAIEAAATLRYPDNRADAADLAEDAHARLAGLLYLTGQLTRRTGIADICDEIAAWEDCRLAGWPQKAVYRSQAEAVAALELAATLLARQSPVPCWCCARWGIYTPGTRQDQGMDPGWLCERCADSSPSACNTRHLKETA